MNFRVLPLVWKILVVLLTFVPGGWTAVAKCTSSWEWSYNSKEQSPCEVAGYLQGACLGYDVYELGPLEPDSWYTEPQEGDAEDLKCGCNTIIYSLYSACTACQDISPQVWSQWNKNCDAVYVTQYPFDIPGVTAVPRWAFVDVTEADEFNVTTARNVGRDPEALGKVPITLSLPSTSFKLSPSNPSDLPSSTISSSPSDPTLVKGGSSSSAFDPLSTNGGDDLDGNSTSEHNDIPAIIGGVIGGVVGFTILSLLVWFSLRYHSREALFYAAQRPFSHRSPSSRRSYYPPPASAYSTEPEMDETGGQSPGIYSRLNATPGGSIAPSHHDPRSIFSFESDVRTTNFSTLHRDDREYGERTAF